MCSDWLRHLREHPQHHERHYMNLGVFFYVNCPWIMSPYPALISVSIFLQSELDFPYKRRTTYSTKLKRKNTNFAHASISIWFRGIPVLFLTLQKSLLLWLLKTLGRSSYSDSLPPISQYEPLTSRSSSSTSGLNPRVRDSVWTDFMTLSLTLICPAVNVYKYAQ